MKITVPLKALKGLGLGDAVRKVTAALGIRKDCGGCDKRQKALNRFKLPK
jgi:hypothetical protein